MQLEDLFREDSEEESDGGTVSSTRDSINRLEVRHNERNRDGSMPGPSRRQEGRQPNGYGNEPSGPPDGVDGQPEPERRRGERKSRRNRKRYRPYRHVTVSESYGECQYHGFNYQILFCYWASLLVITFYILGFPLGYYF